MLDKISNLIHEKIRNRKLGNIEIVEYLEHELKNEYNKKFNLISVILGLILLIVLIVALYGKIFAFEIDGSVKYQQYNQKVYVPEWQLTILQWMKDSGQITLTEMLDLLALRTMECNRYDGMCYGFNGHDIGPFQINRIHKHIYEPSLMLMQAGSGYKELLFYYQAQYAVGLIRSYMERYCKREWTKTNENRFKCVARAYNGHPTRKYIYAELALRKRELIKQKLLDFK